MITFLNLVAELNLLEDKIILLIGLALLILIALLVVYTIWHCKYKNRELKEKRRKELVKDAQSFSVLNNVNGKKFSLTYKEYKRCSEKVNIELTCEITNPESDNNANPPIVPAVATKNNPTNNSLAVTQSVNTNISPSNSEGNADTSIASAEETPESNSKNENKADLTIDPAENINSNNIAPSAPAADGKKTEDKHKNEDKGDTPITADVETNETTLVNDNKADITNTSVKKGTLT